MLLLCHPSGWKYGTRRICSYFDMTEPDHLRGVGISFSSFYFHLFRFLCTSHFSVCKKLLSNLHIAERFSASISRQLVVSHRTNCGLEV